MRPGCFSIIVAALLLASAFRTAGRADDASDREFFEKRIRPVLIEKCYQCHSAVAKDVKGGLLVDHREAIRRGGDSGPAVVPGQPGDSLLIAALRHDGVQMPPDERLPDSVVADFERWVVSGAYDPRETPASPEQASTVAKAEQFEQLTHWWSLQPVASAAPDSQHPGEDASARIDRMIRTRLESAGIPPAPQADRRTRVRRLSFALTGLPPSPTDVETFLKDESPHAWKHVVDRMLSSPHFGEAWARHWMDVVRYSDTYGYEWDIPAKGAWRYRDYLVRAFNQDVPFDQLVREQIAGDLLESPRNDPVERINESQIGTMFFQMGEKRHGDSSEFDGIHQEMLDNKIDAFSKAFQALTISCARCHDHKLDAVRQSEYYALGGAFLSSRWVTNTVDLPDRHEAVRKELAALRAELRPHLADRWRSDVATWLKDAAHPGLNPQGDPPSEPPLEQFQHVWFKLKQAVDAKTPVADAWTEAAGRYRTESESRVKENGGHFTVVADFRKGLPAGWSVDGVGLEQPTPCGDVIVALEGEAAVSVISQGGLVTNSSSPRWNGVVRTPWLNTLEPGHLSFELSGGDFAARRSVIDNAFLTEKQQYIDNRLPQWVLMPTFPEMKERHIAIELATKTSNANFPPRVGLGGACSEVQAADPRSWFAVSRVVRHVAPFTPKDELARFQTLFEGSAPTTLEDAAARFADWWRNSIDRWAAGQATDDDVQILNALLDAKLITNSAASDPAIQDLVTRYRAAETQAKEPWTVNGMADLDPGFDYRFHERGEYDQLKDPVPRGYVQSVAHSAADFHSTGSGRRELAEQIASPDNPLTARVFVNRVWQWLFGTGLVATTNDFGHLGEKPSHPELLDDLAARFMAEGWSVKRLVREIVLTETWQQASDVSEQGRAIDPGNRLLHYYPLRRLEAEAIRDAMLSASGRIDLTVGGPPINPHRMNEDDQKRLFSGPLDGDGRRSIYIKMTIMEPPRFLALFNQPPPKIPTGTRDVTNTPAQSLALLNDPFVAQQAEVWATSLISRGSASVSDRLQQMFVTAFARPASDVEIERWTKAVREFAQLRGVGEEGLLADVAVWKDTAHALFNTKEFLYVK